MANYKIFLNTDDQFLLGYVESDYDNQQLAVLIYDVQQIEIKKLIGSGLYDQIEAQEIAGTTTALNQTLLEKLRPAIRMYVLAKGMLIFNYKIRNKGIVTMSSENSTPVGLDVIARITQEFMDMAQVYAQRVTDYLCENSTSYPLYLNPGNGVDTIHPKNRNYQTGWNLSMGSLDDYYTRGLDNPSQ